ncbi:MAG: hypothetical protein HZB39_15710 [Planctomycetes bacterium]|nr:hypothetical protein [Planctomycetota bacterium]
MPGPTGGDPRAAVAFGNRIVFVARSSLEPGARSLWISDATAAGTREIAPWSVGAYWPGDLAVVNGKVVYTGFSHVNGTEPFVSDGTAAGTGLLFDVNPGLATSSPGQFTVHGGVAYFTAYDPSSGTELWRTDATPQGTSRVADLAPGTRSSSPYELTVAYGALWFVAFDDAGTGQELWTTDGTASGTRLVVDLRPGTGSSSPSALTPIGNGFWFAANDGVHGREPFRSDRSAAGTVLVADLAATRFGSDPGAVRSTRLRAFLHATAPGVGREYFVTDGATAVPWRDAAPGIAWSGEAGLALDGDVAFWSQEGRLFRTDLLGAAPVTIAAVPGLGGNLARLPTGIAFGAGTALWVSDGNAAGTRLVLDFNRSIFYPAGPHAMESFRDGVLFLASEGQLSPNAGLWFSDGTLTGTRLLVPAQVGLGVGARVTTVVDGARVFAAVTANNRIALWISDGTSSTRLTDHTIQSVPARAMARLSSGVVFTGADGVTGAEPWLSDGTPAGTRPLADLAPGGASSSPDQLTAAGRAVFFVADDGTHGRELFVTDGSSPGTRLVRDVVPGPASANPLELFAVGDGELVVCRMHEPGTGAEPWVSDGTAAGTRLLSDLRPGAASSSPAAFARLGRYLVFGANDGLVGREPFVLPLAGLGAHVAETFGAPCPGGSQARPRIAAGGAPVLGANSFGIELAAGRPASPSALLVAAEAGKLLVSGNCAIRAANPFVALSAATDAAGRASIPIAIALDRSLVGVELVTQWLVADPGGALLGAFAASAGLRVVVGS